MSDEGHGVGVFALEKVFVCSVLKFSSDASSGKVQIFVTAIGLEKIPLTPK